MKTNLTSTNALLLLTLLSLGATQASAQTDILANSGKFKPTITFSDTYADKLYTIPAPPPEPGFPRDPATHEVYPSPEKISARIIANLAAFDFATEIDETMPIGIKVGAFEFTSSLGEDHSRTFDRDGNLKPFDPKKTSATFYYYVPVYDREGNPKVDANGFEVQRKAGSLVFAWNVRAKTLTVTLTNTDIAGSGSSSINAGNFLGAADDGVSGGRLSFAGEPAEVTVTFGTATGRRTAYAKGITQTSYRQFGSEAAGTLEGPFLLNSVTVQGSADVAAPVLTAAVPARDADADGLIDITGTVTDLPPGTFSGPTAVLTVNVYVNDLPDAIPAELQNPTETGPDPKGKYLYTVTGLALTKTGANTLTIVATDGGGNSKTVKKAVTTAAPF